MIRMTALLMLAFAVAGMVRAAAPIDFQSAAEQQRFGELIAELRCMVCQNQNLADSDAPLAQDLRREILEQMRAGRNNDQIKQFLTERYGEFVLYRPPVKPETWLLWFAPPLLLLGGGIGLVMAQRRRARQ